MVDPGTVLTTHLTEVLKSHMSELLSYAETKKLLDDLPPEHKKLVEELIPSQISVTGVQRVLQTLLGERVSIRDLPAILEGIAEAVGHTKNALYITEHVRARLARQLCHANLSPGGYLPLLALSPAWEQAFAESIVGQGEERQLAMAPSQLQQFIQTVRERFDEAGAKNEVPVLLTSPQVRPFVRSIIERFRPQTVVMSQNEIHASVRLRTLGPGVEAMTGALIPADKRHAAGLSRARRRSLRGLLTAALKRHRLPEQLIETLIREAGDWPGCTPKKRWPARWPRACAWSPHRSGKSARHSSGRARRRGQKRRRRQDRPCRRCCRAARSNWPTPPTGWPCSAPAPIRRDGLMVMEAEGFNPVNRRAPQRLCRLGRNRRRGKHRRGFRRSAMPKMSAKSSARLRFRRVIVTGLDRTRRLGATVAAITGGARLAHVTHGPRPDDPLETLAPGALAKLLLD